VKLLHDYILQFFPRAMLLSCILRCKVIYSNIKQCNHARPKGIYYFTSLYIALYCLIMSCLAKSISAGNIWVSPVYWWLSLPPCITLHSPAVCMPVRRSADARCRFARTMLCFDGPNLPIAIFHLRSHDSIYSSLRSYSSSNLTFSPFAWVELLCLSCGGYQGHSRCIINRGQI